MKKTKLTRRDLILRTPAALAGLLLLGSGVPRPASAQQPKSQSQRPSGACGRWSDKDMNGFCDRSEGGAKPCGLKTCPAHKDNPKRQDAQSI